MALQTEHMVEEARLAVGQGAILVDRRRVGQAAGELLDPAHWGEAGTSGRGGRGQVWFVRGDFGAAVLRHYRRGGLIGRLLSDRYLWLGEARTRAFREFRLLAELCRRGLPVPAPLAAGYRREGLLYRADMLMQQIADAHTLAERLPGVLADRESMQRLGAVLGRFHAEGVCHADLNAHNLLRNGAGRWWLIDFDRGRLRAPARGWQQRRLQRLQRSLRKLGAEHSPHWPAAWDALLAGHEQEVGG
jgi:3-deoxy-D-manno-octulosonic acid kinase